MGTEKVLEEAPLVKGPLSRLVKNTTAEFACIKDAQQELGEREGWERSDLGAAVLKSIEGGVDGAALYRGMVSTITAENGYGIYRSLGKRKLQTIENQQELPGVVAMLAAQRNQYLPADEKQNPHAIASTFAFTLLDRFTQTKIDDIVYFAEHGTDHVPESEQPTLLPLTSDYLERIETLILVAFWYSKKAGTPDGKSLAKLSDAIETSGKRLIDILHDNEADPREKETARSLFAQYSGAPPMADSLTVMDPDFQGWYLRMRLILQAARDGKPLARTVKQNHQTAQLTYAALQTDRADMPFVVCVSHPSLEEHIRVEISYEQVRSALADYHCSADEHPIELADYPDRTIPGDCLANQLADDGSWFLLIKPTNYDFGLHVRIPPAYVSSHLWPAAYFFPVPPGQKNSVGPLDLDELSS